MGSRCDFKFDDNPNKIYYAGETISGVAELKLNAEVRVKKVELIIEGNGECKWEESDNQKSLFQCKEQYLNSVTLLIPTETVIPSELQSFNFRLQLPSIIPSSMNEKFGNVSYKVILKLSRPSNFDLVFVETFTVICRIDFESNPSWLLPCEQEEIKRYRCLCFQTNPITISLKIPKSAYIPREKILIEARVSNKSDIFISQVETNLIKRIVYESNKPIIKRKIQEVLIYEKEIPEQIRMETKIFQINLTVPKTLPSTANPNFRAITITYELWFRVKTPGLFKSPVLKVPILIGAAPRSTSVTEEPSRTLQAPSARRSRSPSPQFNSTNVRTPTAPANEPDEPPPPFEEAMRNCLPYINPEAVRNYDMVRPLGFTIPVINEIPKTNDNNTNTGDID